MKINYNRLVELNSEAIKEDGREMTCYFVVQSGIEKIMNGEELVKEHKKMLLDVGVLELTEEDIVRETMVKQFNFSQNGPTNS
jgi:archaeosine-15-forming tRNA-guanine transglycosylase